MNLARNKTARALDISSPIGADRNNTIPYPKLYSLVTESPKKLIKIGDIRELINNAGNVDNIPAINIHSPCLRVVLKPKYSFDVDHHANTGVEKPKIQAGKAIMRNKSIVNGLIPVTRSGSINRLETITPIENMSHNCLTLGISSGAVLCTR